MAIKFPEHCRNVTKGALRQLQQTGATTASGGLFSNKFVTGKIQSTPAAYFWPSEPGGKFMDALENTKQAIEENTEAIQSSGRKLVDAANEANKQMAAVTGKFRSGTEHLGVAIDKLMKVAGRPDYEQTVKLTESLVDSLERLAVLEEKGLLDKVMSAMRSRT